MEILTIDNISAQVYTINKLFVENNDSKALELTNLLRMLLNAGVYRSVQDAYEDGVPVGAFVVIDDPETPELEYNVQIVRPGSI
jgi:hypothetical protein